MDTQSAEGIMENSLTTQSIHPNAVLFQCVQDHELAECVLEINILCHHAKIKVRTRNRRKARITVLAAQARPFANFSSNPLRFVWRNDSFISS
jgi:hypothetical protein